MFKKSSIALSVALTLGLTAVGTSSFAQEVEKKDKEDAELTYEKLIEDRQVQEGLFNLYRDEKNGSLMMSIHEEQLDTPFLYFALSADGVLEAGHFRGNYREDKIIEFRRYYDRVDVIQKPIRYKFDASSALSRASEANQSTAVLISLPIKHEEDGRIVFEADDLFLSENLHKVSPYARPGGGESFQVGSLSKSQSRIVGERVYPDNLDLVVNYVFNNPNPSQWGSNAVADARSTSITLQHSFIQLPENDFKPRRDDARVGYFTNQFDNMTSADWAPYEDVIQRWHLVKEDPSAELSEPVEPIVFYLENTTPEAWREVIKEGVLAWNPAFEKAGFKNAIQVKIQPDDADWDAGDVRYNVIRWTSSPNPPFGGYGPSLANPLTGQILGADIMMEYIYMTNRWVEGEIYDANENFSTPNTGFYCSQGHYVNQGLVTGQAMAGLLGNESVESNELLRQGLIHVILHEVGHTLGLNHNMKASILWDHEQVHDKSLTQGVLTGSVMDYAPVNIAPPGYEQGDYYQYKVGPYDEWAIEFGYSTAVEDEQQEKARLEAILSRSHEHGLAFGNDADDMRYPGLHIDPQVMIDDLSSNPVAYAKGRFDVINQTFERLVDTARPAGQSHEQITSIALRLLSTYRVQAGVVSRQIAGVHVNRAVIGQATDGQKPFTPVPKAQQQAAMEVLGQYIFAQDALTAMQPVLGYMQRQRRGFDHFAINEDPKFHQYVALVQGNVLNQLIHPATAQRALDSTHYGNTYGYNEILNDLTHLIFPENQTISTTGRQLQIEYVKRLIAAAGIESETGFDYVSRGYAYAQLEKIQAKRAPRRADFELTAHYNYIQRLIQGALKA